MKKTTLRWLISPLLLLLAATCSDSNVGGNNASCLSGVDIDADGLNDDVECSLGSDPTKTDSDGDGIADGQEVQLGTSPTMSDSDGDSIPDGEELAYPKICVAGDRNQQRRPAPSCTDASACSAGETCTGLDPTKSDSDGDGVTDYDEDKDQNGTISVTSGETDPRLFDTDGDGQSDKDTGSKICRADGLAMVTRAPLPGQSIQLGHDPVFGTSRIASGAQGSAALVDDAGTGVAGLVVGKAAAGADVTADRLAIEAAIQSALTAAGATVSNVFVGRQFATHEQNPGTLSTFRVARMGSSASALRDALVQPLIGAAAPAGSSVGASGTFTMDVSVIRRQGVNDIIVTLAPSADYDDISKQTAIRANDLFNASGVAFANKDLDFVCQGIVTEKIATADILWTVDVSGSMDGNQVLLANTATQFFQRLQSAGVDFRVGVFAAASSAPTLTTTTYPGWPNGFTFINSSDLMGPQLLCRQVTAPGSGNNGFCPADLNKTNDPLGPFGLTGEREEPAAQAVLVNDLFKRNAAMGVANPNFSWRPGVTKVAFLVTDELGTSDDNDWERYFKTTNNPDTGQPFAAAQAYDATTLGNIVKYFKDNQIQTYGMVPVNNTATPRACTAYNTGDLPRCLIEGNGGAWVDVNNATPEQIQAAMNKLVDAVAGAASQFKLTRTPITSTIKVTVRNLDVPRSRQNGFDYDPVSKSVVFYGSPFRPNIGDQVYISYRVWKGSIG